jgi:hypothetical protein
VPNNASWVSWHSARPDQQRVVGFGAADDPKDVAVDRPGLAGPRILTLAG